jgi:hypothetical protein
MAKKKKEPVKEVKKGPKDPFVAVRATKPKEEF